MLWKLLWHLWPLTEVRHLNIDPWEVRRSTPGLSVIALFILVCHRLDYAAENWEPSMWHTVDTSEPVRGHGFSSLHRSIVTKSWKHATNDSYRHAMVSTKTGLKINKSQTKVIRANINNAERVKLKKAAIGGEDFTYLGSNINRDIETDRDIQARIEKAIVVFEMMITLPRKTKLRL